MSNTSPSYIGLFFILAAMMEQILLACDLVTSIYLFGFAAVALSCLVKRSIQDFGYW